MRGDFSAIAILKWGSNSRKRRGDRVRSHGREVAIRFLNNPPLEVQLSRIVEHLGYEETGLGAVGMRDQTHLILTSCALAEILAFDT